VDYQQAGKKTICFFPDSSSINDNVHLLSVHIAIAYARFLKELATPTSGGLAVEKN
jgi:hypothetical protein